jgi:hypothetical protein
MKYIHNEEFLPIKDNVNTKFIDIDMVDIHKNYDSLSINISNDDILPIHKNKKSINYNNVIEKFLCFMFIFPLLSFFTSNIIINFIGCWFIITLILFNLVMFDIINVIILLIFGSGSFIHINDYMNK